ncbi:MAG: hypothetical protein ABIQ86_16650 [Steroidobacteraceae bacterium]
MFEKKIHREAAVADIARHHMQWVGVFKLPKAKLCSLCWIPKMGLEVAPQD